MRETAENSCLLEHFSEILKGDKPRVTKELQVCAFSLALGLRRPNYHLGSSLLGSVGYVLPLSSVHLLRIEINFHRLTLSIPEYNHAIC